MQPGRLCQIAAQRFIKLLNSILYGRKKRAELCRYHRIIRARRARKYFNINSFSAFLLFSLYKACLLSRNVISPRPVTAAVVALFVHFPKPFFIKNKKDHLFLPSAIVRLLEQFARSRTVITAGSGEVIKLVAQQFGPLTGWIRNPALLGVLRGTFFRSTRHR